jgi:hypothetical protein
LLCFVSLIIIVKRVKNNVTFGFKFDLGLLDVPYTENLRIFQFDLGLLDVPYTENLRIFHFDLGLLDVPYTENLRIFNFG